MALSFEVPLCVTPVSADGRSPARSPLSTDGFASVRLVFSISAISAVVRAILGKRVQQGDELRVQAELARQNGFYDLAAAAITTPSPQLSVTGFERGYYAVQFAAALCPPVHCPFTGSVLPDISIQAYIVRLLSFNTTVSNACYILMIALLDKVMLYHPELFLHTANAHRLILAAFVVAAKYHEDAYIPNADFAKIGGVSVDELNVLEVSFLRALDWRCHFSKERFEDFEISVVKEALDTPQGLSIFQVLRAQHVAGLDDAVRRTHSWNMGDVPMSPVSEKQDPNLFGGSWDKAQASKLRLARGEHAARGIISGIALSLSNLNYPEVPLFPKNESEMLKYQMFSSCYSTPARKRLFVLQRLASSMPTKATEVPNMFVTPFPRAAAIKEVMPSNMTNSHVVEYGNVAKASVNFLLNDIDPFEDLAPVPIELPAPCSMMTTMERECGLEGLLQ